MFEQPSHPPSRRVLVTGGTGYLGQAAIPRLLAHGHAVRALVRGPSAGRVPAGVELVVGDALSADDVARAFAGCDTVVHLVGVPRPSPAKARQFTEVDLASIIATTRAIAASGTRPHLVYLSVAQPAPIMKAYLAVRAEGEALVTALNIPATFLRPWYVLGPGHRWPYAVMPIYALLRVLPATREAARRLGFVTLPQMVQALVAAVENPPPGVRIVDVPAIRVAGRGRPPGGPESTR